MRRSTDENFMAAALREARRAAGRTSPNPAVGAVVVHENRIIARGHHRAAGMPHAEAECIAKLCGKAPRGAALYVTLEPCSTTGRTPPCTQAIVEAEFASVVVGAIDVNPLHAGRGLALLREAGIDVRSGILGEECARLNEAFNHWVQTRRPFVIAKCGMSLDGRLTRPPGERRWLTSAAARAHANSFRSQVDAILIGAETLRADNPRLTARASGPKRQPWRVVWTRSGRLPRRAHLFSDRFAERTLVFRNVPLEEVLRELGHREITSLLIEGGGDVLGQALDTRLINRLHLYLAPLFTGGPVPAFAAGGAGHTGEALRLADVRYERIGAVIFLTGSPTAPPKAPE